MVRMRRWTTGRGDGGAHGVDRGEPGPGRRQRGRRSPGFAFDPATVTIQVGDSVTWTNEDSVAHTATAG